MKLTVLKQIYISSLQVLRLHHPHGVQCLVILHLLVTTITAATMGRGIPVTHPDMTILRTKTIQHITVSHKLTGAAMDKPPLPQLLLARPQHQAMERQDTLHLDILHRRRHIPVNNILTQHCLF